MKNSSNSSTNDAQEVLVVAQKIAALTQVIRFLRASQMAGDNGIACHLQLADQQQTRTVVNSKHLVQPLIALADELRSDLEEQKVDLDKLLAEEETQFNKLYS